MWLSFSKGQFATANQPNWLGLGPVFKRVQIGQQIGLFSPFCQTVPNTLSHPRTHPRTHARTHAPTHAPTHARTHPWRSAGAQKGFRLFFLITGDTRLTNTQSYPAKVNEEYLVVSFLIVSVTSKHLVPLLTKTSSPPSLEVTLIILRKKHFGGILIC